MTITVDTKTRTAIIGGTASFAAGENIDVVLSNVRSPDLSTLVLVIWSDEGVKLAQADQFIAVTPAVDDTWTSPLTTKTMPITTLFAGKDPGWSARCQLIISDEDNEFVTQQVVLKGNANSVPGEDPVPETFVTLVMLEAAIEDHNASLTAHPTLVRKSDFADVVLVDPEVTTQEGLTVAVREIQTILKGSV